jgi:hypothetical protein
MSEQDKEIKLLDGLEEMHQAATKYCEETHNPTAYYGVLHGWRVASARLSDELKVQDEANEILTRQLGEKDAEIISLQSKLATAEQEIASKQLIIDAAYKLDAERQSALSTALEVLEFYSNGGNPPQDVWEHKELGYFTGKRAREAIARIKGDAK